MFVEGKKRRVLKTCIIGTVFVGAFIVLIPVLLASNQYKIFSFEIGTIRYVGIIPLILGGYMSLCCVKDFIIQGKGTPAPFDPPEELVVSGFYKYLRNPMYFGLFLVILGEAVFFSSANILIYLLFFIIICNLFIIFYEEPKLSVKFGDAYINYCKEVNRWVPSVYFSKNIRK